MSNLSTFLGGGISLWVSGATYSVNDVVRSPSNYMTYVRIVGGAGATDPSSDSTNWRQVGGMVIKSIQRGVISAATATITSVNTAKTELRLLGQTAGTSANYDNVSRIVLTNSTTITKASDQGLGQGLSWELTEYY